VCLLAGDVWLSAVDGHADSWQAFTGSHTLRLKKQYDITLAV